MNQHVKLVLYLVLVTGACVSGFFAWRNYGRMGRAQPADSTGVEVSAVEGRVGKRASDGYATAMWTFGVLFVVSVIGLGFLLGHDVAHYVGNKALTALYNDDGEGLRDPEYDRAEQEWADGRHLEAIRLMREYLQKNPRQIHAALRIAEIYEKDLQNPLAAALEYEEILEHNLPRERWGWAAIHLCNLYFKLTQPEKAVALLRRIDAEFGETQAADKARQRLALFEAESAQGNVTG